MLRNRPPIKYDVVSLDIGSSPDPCGVPGAKEHATAVKPISTFIKRLHALLGEMHHQSDAPRTQQGTSEIQPDSRLQTISKRRLGERGCCVVVVGGGAGGVELAFAIKQRLLSELHQTNQESICEPVIKYFSLS